MKCSRMHLRGDEDRGESRKVEWIMLSRLRLIETPIVTIVFQASNVVVVCGHSGGSYNMSPDEFYNPKPRLITLSIYLCTFKCKILNPFLYICAIGNYSRSISEA